MTPDSLNNSTIANPIGTDGFEFVEFASPDMQSLVHLFESFGFNQTAKHKSKNIYLYQQGDVNLIINAEPKTFAARFMAKHGPCACAMAFRVNDARTAFLKLCDRGAIPYESDGKFFNYPAIRGIGDSLIYLIDTYGKDTIYSQDFEPTGKPVDQKFHITYLDHLTHNVYQGNMDKWADFYIKLFNFRQIRYFDIRGLKSGLVSRAMISPCNKIRIPINESVDNVSQIAEYLRQYKGEGIQHIAFGSGNIYETVEKMRQSGVDFMTVPDTYYELVQKRLPGHTENIKRMSENRILIDGEMNQPGKPLLLQIFTNTVIGPIFFEMIQRKGHPGFGEGNFQALFESIELDQIRRGVL